MIWCKRLIWVRLRLWGLLLLCLWPLACAKQLRPVDGRFLPQGYHAAHLAEREEAWQAEGWLFLELHTSAEDLGDLFQIWRDGLLQPAFEQEHPIQQVQLGDLFALLHALANELRVFYLQSTQKTPTWLDLNQTLGCSPLNNQELLFLLQGGNLMKTNQKPLTLLLLSLHQLMLNRGLQPQYPQVASAYLRHRYGLKPLVPLQRQNLAELAKLEKSDLPEAFGFVICRRN